MYSRIFVFDCETSGFPGVCTHDLRNNIIQLAALHPATRSTFNFLCKSVEFIPEESVACHGIATKDLEDERKTLTKDQLKEQFSTWIEKLSPQTEDLTKVYLLAHNVGFDQELLLTILPTLPENWVFVDTLKMVREYFPELQQEIWPEKQPYNLGNIYKRFFQEVMPNQHDAMGDVNGLTRLFEEVLKDKMFEKPPRNNLEGKEEEEEEEESMKEPNILDILEHFKKNLIKDVSETLIEQKGFAEYICGIIAAEVNDFFENHGDLLQHKTNGYYLSFLHLIILGAKKVKDNNKAKDHGYLTWHPVLEEIERFLRQILIPSKGTLVFIGDKKIALILASCAQKTPRQLTVEDGFPFVKGEPLSYEPFKLTEEESRELFEKTGLGTFHEIFHDYMYSAERKDWWENNLKGFVEPRFMKEKFQELRKWG